MDRAICLANRNLQRCDICRKLNVLWHSFEILGIEKLRMTAAYCLQLQGLRNYLEISNLRDCGFKNSAYFGHIATAGENHSDPKNIGLRGP